MSIYIILFIVLIHVITGHSLQLPQQCLRMNDFTACVNTGRLNIATCSGLVLSTPTVEYYQCQCTEYTKIESCYSFCADDPQLQLQLLTEKSTKSSVCSQVEIMLAQGAKFSSTLVKSIATSTETIPVASTTNSVSIITTSNESAVPTAATSAPTSPTTSTSRNPNSNTLNFNDAREKDKFSVVFLVLVVLVALLHASEF